MDYALARAAAGPMLALVFLTSAAFAKDKSRDPDEIGNRNVGKGVNLYSLEKEMR